MNATRNEFQSLAEDQVLIPFTDMPTISAPWRCSDGTALVDELSGNADTIDTADDGWERIQRAKVRTRTPVGVIIKAIRDGQIRVGHTPETTGYSGLCVCKVEIDNLVQAVQEARGLKELAIAAFGRQVGMRDQARIQNLVDAGHITAIKRRNPFTGRMQLHIKSEDITAFHDRFFTLSTVSTAYGVHQRTLLARLKAAGIKPFAPNGLDFGYLYLRQDIEAFLGECRIL